MVSRSSLLAMAGVAAVVASLGVAGGFGQMHDDARTLRVTSPEQTGGYVVVVPEGSYQSFVVSPSGTTGTVHFILRAQTPEGASDFPFFIPAGEVRSIEFPHGLTLRTASALIAPRNVSFAAWGVSAGTRKDESLTPGRLVRFEPLGRDIERDDRDRQRTREFDEFLREVERLR